MLKKINANEASLFRWIATGVVGYLLGIVLMIPWIIVQVFSPDLIQNSPLGFMEEIVSLMISFFFQFWGLVLAIKWIGKTSLRDFILGEGGRIHKGECLTVLGLYALGLVLCTLPGVNNISLRGIEPGQCVMLFVFCLLFVWMQTSWEELLVLPRMW